MTCRNAVTKSQLGLSRLPIPLHSLIQIDTSGQTKILGRLAKLTLRVGGCPHSVYIRTVVIMVFDSANSHNGSCAFLNAFKFLTLQSYFCLITRRIV